MDLMVAYNKTWRCNTNGVMRYLAIVALLLLGVLNPLAGSRIDSFAGFFVLSLVAVPSLSNSKLFLMIVFLITLGFFSQIKGFDIMAVWGILTGFSLAFVLEKFKAQRFAVFVLIAAFLISSYAASGDLRAMLARDLPLYTYNNDPGVFLKTYQQLESGQPYYLSLLKAHDGRFAQRGMPTDIWGLRMPTLFYIWSFLPGGGTGIYILFLAISSGALFCAYKITEKYLGSRSDLLSSYLLFPYLHYAARDQMMLETEWWGVIIFIIGLCFLLFRKHFFAVISLSLSTLIRELFIIPVFLLLIYYFFTDRKLIYITAIPFFAFCLLFLVHLTAANYYIDAFGSLFRPRVIPFGNIFLQQTFAFGSWEYLLFMFKPFYLLFVLAIVGSLFIFLRKSKTDGLIILFSFLIFPIAFLKIGTLPFNDYWGILFMPQTLIFAPLSLGWVLKQPK